MGPPSVGPHPRPRLPAAEPRLPPPERRRRIPFMPAARFLALARAARFRRDLALRFCAASARRETVVCLSRLRARVLARFRRAEGARGFRRPCPVSLAGVAARRVRSEVRPPAGALTGMPARRALESPMAIACFDARAPCLPLRTWSISWRTNSPAAVEGRFPAERSRFAFLTVLLVGIVE